MGILFYAMVYKFTTVYFVFSQIWNSNFSTLQPLSRYHFNIKLSIKVKNMLTIFHVNQGPVSYILTGCKHMVLIHRNVKITIIMFQCKTYLNTGLV